MDFKASKLWKGWSGNLRKVRLLGRQQQLVRLNSNRFMPKSRCNCKIAGAFRVRSEAESSNPVGFVPSVFTFYTRHILQETFFATNQLSHFVFLIPNFFLACAANKKCIGILPWPLLLPQARNWRINSCWAFNLLMMANLSCRRSLLKRLCMIIKTVRVLHVAWSIYSDSICRPTYVVHGYRHGPARRISSP